MKKSILTVLIIVVSLYQINAQSNSPYRNFGHNAENLAKSQLRYSLFTFSEYGINDQITLIAHPLWVFLSPDISLKWNLSKNSTTVISLMHGLSCPTPILSLISRKGTGGVISPEFDIPFMLAIKNGILANYHFYDNHVFSAGLAIEFALFNDKLEPGSSIDLPVIAPRFNVFYRNPGIEFNIGVEGKLYKKFDYYTKTELFLFPFQNKNFKEEYGNTNGFFGELTGMAFWNISKKFKLGLGGRLCYGSYPFGTQWHLLPAIDFVKYTK